MKKKEAMEQALSLANRSTIAMLGTYGDGYPDIRAMIKNENDGLKTIWFTTNTSSKKIEQLKKTQKACVYFVDFDKRMGLKLIGTIDILQDPESRRRLWREGFEKYYPLGECRNSQGNPGTDKLFTGQRLDGTGLYYYGARYYDASIGRFISADTIVQSPGNPQTLNRYSYCLNNPLAYIDPSGNIVEFENEQWILLLSEFRLGFEAGSELEAKIKNWAALRFAWEELSTVASALTQMLEKASQTITIKWSNEVTTSGLVQAEDWRYTGNMDMLIGNRLKGDDVRFMASLMGHEGFHAAAHIAGHSWACSTAANEAFAYSFGYLVSQKLGYADIFGQRCPLSAEFSNISPFTASRVLSTQIEKAQETLSAWGYHRENDLAYLHPWPGLFGWGRGSFLTVAKSVWIK